MGNFDEVLIWWFWYRSPNLNFNNNAHAYGGKDSDCWFLNFANTNGEPFHQIKCSPKLPMYYTMAFQMWQKYQTKNIKFKYSISNSKFQKYKGPTNSTFQSIKCVAKVQRSCKLKVSKVQRSCKLKISKVSNLKVSKV